MFRPKKKITKKEIKRDPFLETVDQAQAILKKTDQNIYKWALELLH